MEFSVSGFTTGLIGVLISAVILGAMLTVFASITIPEGIANGDAIATIIGIIPLLAGCGLAVFSVYLFITRK